MPEIKPFRGILYNPKKVELADVVAPPYDVISPQQQQELYDRSPFNIVRLILGREENRYSSAARYLEQWRGENILITDEATSIYILSQTFEMPDGKQVQRRGFIVACILEDLGKGSIFPHERTHSKPKEDRFQLFQATNVMFSQIFGLYSDPKHILDKYLIISAAPELKVEFEGVMNTLSKLKDPSAIAAISEFLKSEKILVADGHHRYETALLYRNAQRMKNPNHTGKEAYNFVPMFVTNMSDPGLVVLPTHRLVHSLNRFSQKELLEALQEYFYIDIQPSADEMIRNLEARKTESFGLAMPKEPEFVLLRFNKNSTLKMNDVPDVLGSLDVGILHSLIFKKILHISEDDQAKKLNLEYEKDAHRAIEMVKAGRTQMAFLMNPTRVEQVRAVAESGLTMPQKST